MDSDVILALSGIGPKVVENIHGKLNELAADMTEFETADEEQVIVDETSADSDKSEAESLELVSADGEEQETKTADEELEIEPKDDDSTFTETIEQTDDTMVPDYEEDGQDIDKLLQSKDKKKKASSSKKKKGTKLDKKIQKLGFIMLWIPEPTGVTCAVGAPMILAGRYLDKKYVIRITLKKKLRGGVFCIYAVSMHCSILIFVINGRV